MIRLVSAWVLVNGLLMTPVWVAGAVTDASALAWLSVEAALIVGAMALLPQKPWSRGLAWVLAGGVVLCAAALFADLVFRVSLGRSINLSLDLYLLNAVYRLAVGNSGLVRSLFGFVAIGLFLALSMFATAWLLTPVDSSEDKPRSRLVTRFGAGVLVGTFALGLIGFGLETVGQRLAAPAAALVLDQAQRLSSTRQERRAFASDLERQPDSFGDLPGLLSKLEGRNVVVAYIESYGMSALEDAEFAATIRPSLEAASERIEGAGLRMVTGKLASPTQGGQSWYAHGTMLSGLWLENQLRYDLLIASERETLVNDFHQAGYRTATVMPAITTSWPEGTRLGYDDIYTQASIPYSGPPFYWVTMPDQFTWSFVGEIVAEATTPLFVEAGMVSSHAPWTPVLPIVEWDSVAEGAIFLPYRREGYPPEQIWWNTEVLRKNYARSLDYSVQTMAQFAERFLDERTLLVVLGDHEAAPWVTGAIGPDVPVHVIARDPILLEPFVEWGFRPGAFPDPEGSTPRMDEFREWFVRAFSGVASGSAALSTTEGT